MSTSSSPTTPKARPAELAVSSSSPSSTTNALGRTQNSIDNHPAGGLNVHSCTPRGFAPTGILSTPKPRARYRNTAPVPTTHYTPPNFHATVANGSRNSSLHVAPDGFFVPTPAGFGFSTAPGHYRSPFDYNMAHRTSGMGAHILGQLRYETETPIGMMPRRSAPGAPVPAPLHARQVRAVIPPPGVTQRLILLGPLRMIRSQCVKIEMLRPILIWIDQFMGADLHTPAQTDALIPNVVYAVNIPMDDEHWKDWKKVLTVFPRAEAWQEALTPDEPPFDQVTEDHPTMMLFREGKKLESLLSELVQTYNLGIQFDVNRPWDLPGQTDWMAPRAREALARLR